MAEKQNGAVDGKEDAPVAEFGPGNVVSGNEAADTEACVQVAANWAELGDMTEVEVEVEVEVVLGHVLAGDPAVGSENAQLQQHDKSAVEG